MIGGWYELSENIYLDTEEFMMKKFKKDTLCGMIVKGNLRAAPDSSPDELEEMAAKYL